MWGDVLIVTSWEVLLGSSESREAAKYCTMHRTDPTSIIWSKMSVVWWLRNPDLEETRVGHGSPACAACSLEGPEASLVNSMRALPAPQISPELLKALYPATPTVPAW